MKDTILINLLPQEFTKAQLEQAKYYKLRLVSIASLMMMVFLASITIALRVLQNSNLDQARFTLEAAEGKVSQYKQIEVSLVVLKDRLSNINQIIATSSKQNAMYSLINSLIPPTISIDSITVDRNGNTVLGLSTNDSEVLDDFITSLVDSSKNEFRITFVEVDSFSRSRESLYRAHLKVVAK